MIYLLIIKHQKTATHGFKLEIYLNSKYWQISLLDFYHLQQGKQAVKELSNDED